MSKRGRGGRSRSGNSRGQTVGTGTSRNATRKQGGYEDDTGHNTNRSQIAISASNPPGHLFGLPNRGLTCYLNSALQAFKVTFLLMVAEGLKIEKNPSTTLRNALIEFFMSTQEHPSFPVLIDQLAVDERFAKVSSFEMGDAMNVVRDLLATLRDEEKKAKLTFGPHESIFKRFQLKMREGNCSGCDLLVPKIDIYYHPLTGVDIIEEVKKKVSAWTLCPDPGCKKHKEQTLYLPEYFLFRCNKDAKTKIHLEITVPSGRDTNRYELISFITSSTSHATTYARYDMKWYHFNDNDHPEECHLTFPLTAKHQMRILGAIYKMVNCTIGKKGKNVEDIESGEKYPKGSATSIDSASIDRTRKDAKGSATSIDRTRKDAEASDKEHSSKDFKGWCDKGKCDDNDSDSESSVKDSAEVHDKDHSSKGYKGRCDKGKSDDNDRSSHSETSYKGSSDNEHRSKAYKGGKSDERSSHSESSYKGRSDKEHSSKGYKGQWDKGKSDNKGIDSEASGMEEKTGSTVKVAKKPSQASGERMQKPVQKKEVKREITKEVILEKERKIY